MADSTYIPKVYHKQGGAEMVVASGGQVNVETGGKIVANGTQASAPTAALATLTIADAAGTPDYSIAAITATTPYGFANAQDAIDLLYVVKNLQTRGAELEAALRSIGVMA